jgi:hypothetical protein
MITNVYLPKISPKTSDSELSDSQTEGTLATPAGQNLPKIKGYCIISVSSQQILDTILAQKFVLKSKSLLIREFIKNSSDMDRIDLETCLRRVCIMNIPMDVKEHELENLMMQNFGGVEKSYMRQPKGNKNRRPNKKYMNRPKTKYGFVTFLAKESRDKAISRGCVHDSKGRRIQIKPFRSKNESRNQKMRNIELQKNQQKELKEFELFKEFKRMKKLKSGHMNTNDYKQYTQFQAHR